ncbi:hypothetical protein ACFL0Z_02575 [Patescibacteria group bacterium]
MEIPFLAASQLNWEGLTQFLEQNQASWNSAIILIFVILLFFYFGAGLGKASKGMISVYVALAIVNTVTYFSPDGPEINVPGALVLKLGSFIGLSLVILFLWSQFSFRGVIRTNFGGNIIERLIFGALGAGMIVAILISFMPAEILSTISPTVQLIFHSDLGFAAWMIAPIFCLLFVKYRDK